MNIQTEEGKKEEWLEGITETAEVSAEHWVQSEAELDTHTPDTVDPHNPDTADACHCSVAHG